MSTRERDEELNETIAQVLAEGGFSSETEAMKDLSHHRFGQNEQI